ncbi:hypothetical protein CONPUDRAFT_137081 [Coniophora puteana RWD-64-598 SS2]|uniref:Uncharacterized protein n=1 Tax=Coniophora puteana (strain RWD-64-598) TaxID=741705 RepID=A0A5M3MQF3_CONPW|nr:uncharacterized protein CONPUDRAFT_137081 [Coniophora puteana RWD-64-598 SS2]EIW80954.1 hypothetical protein CONPUDRAFT_137081 [Coniophora puteana RWD-64-598 SS2]
MERLCDEVIQLILYELNDPTHLTLASKRFLHVSRDPYVRAHYFLTRYGKMQAMFWALGRGRLMTDKVIDILITSGACFSRYLVQVAIHHYFRSAPHFVKTQWTRSIPLSVFTHFIKVASDMYGEIPLAKGDDDGSVFTAFLKESRLPAELKSTKWEDIREIFKKFKFMPFSAKDPIMTQFPLALAVEPRLLPYAQSNGFSMDTKYRDFVFRKMFEKHTLSGQDRSGEIVSSVRELKRLDPRMFMTRTVAAEICMEAKSNESAYKALKALNLAGELLFELGTLVEDLIKLFMNTRSISSSHTIQVLRQLHEDFPSSDPAVRLVMLLTVFVSDIYHNHTPPAELYRKIETLGLAPLTKKDLFDIMTSPFVERVVPIIDIAKDYVGLSSKAVRELVQRVTFRCLEIGCKGKTLRKLRDWNTSLSDSVLSQAFHHYSINTHDLPPHEDEKACMLYEVKLCRDFSAIRASYADEAADTHDGQELDGSDEDEVAMEIDPQDGVSNLQQPDEVYDLGPIGQDTLTYMIRQDEMGPSRHRRRSSYNYTGTYIPDGSGKLQYPSDYLQVGKWVKETFSPHSAIAATFMTHASINGNDHLLHIFLASQISDYASQPSHLPITLKHFKLLAHLGRAPSWSLYHAIQLGAEFYFSEEDYLGKEPALITKRWKGKARAEIKKESSPISLPLDASGSTGPSKASSSSRRKRPRRSAVEVAKSYVIPDSDDEAIAPEPDDSDVIALRNNHAKKRRVETNLQRWIKHLALLLSEEQRKYKEKRKRLERQAPPDVKVRVSKSDFYKSLTGQLRDLRKIDLEKRRQLYGPDVAAEVLVDESDDDEYHVRPSKRMRV